MRTLERRPVFYVYEHWRPDTDMPFYVGKGYKNRAQEFRKGRNSHHRAVVAELSAVGMCVEVRMVASGLKETEAFAIERSRIEFWRASHVDLVNITDGGHGTAGLRHTDETKKKIRDRRTLQQINHSAETRRKIGEANSVALKGKKNPEHSARMRGRKHSDEHKAAISEGLKGRQVSDETRQKIRIANTGKKSSDETKRRLSLSHKGKSASIETKIKMTLVHISRWAAAPQLKESVSVKMTAWWSDPDNRAKMIKSRKETAANPEYRATLSEAAKAAWARRKEKASAPNS